MKKNRIEQLLAYLKDTPNDSFVLFALAKEYERAEQFEESLVWYQKLKKIDPNHVGLYYHLAALLYQLSRKTEAKMVYEEGITIAKRLQDHHAENELKAAYNLQDWV